jgi:AbrB family looped-hinge helix DNA binding protein
MMSLHDRFIEMKGVVTTLTERGQVSMPASIRKQLGLKAGQPLVWEKVSDDECRVRIVRRNPEAAKSMRGFMKRLQTDPTLPKTTAGWMKLLREGERD